MLHFLYKKTEPVSVPEGPRRRKRARDGKLSDLAEAIVARPVAPTLSTPVILGLVQLLEAAGLAAIGIVLYAVLVNNDLDGVYALVVLGAVLVANVLFNFARTHRLIAYRSLLMQIGRVLGAWTLTCLLITATAFLFKISEILSRAWLLEWFAAGSLFLVAFRLGLRSLINRWTSEGKLRRRTVIVGGGTDAQVLVEAIRTGGENDIELFGLFDDRLDERSPHEVAGCPKLGTVDDLVQFARRTRVDLVIVSMPLSAEKRVLQMLQKLWVLPVDIRLSAHMSRIKFMRSTYSYVADVAVFDMADKPISDWNLVFKWVFDKVIALTAIIVFSPLMLATAIAVKLESKGPVLFRQQRHGFNNELIEIYKFRSMYTDMTDAQAAKLVTRDDPRVTRVGRFIRRTSIDELPQLFNVLFDQISIVGPRPHALQAKAADRLYDEAVDGYFARHKVKPGMTGWAQINGWRGETDTVEKIMQRVKHDLYYIENWSPLLDFYIVLMTPISLFQSKENAY